MTPFPIPDAAIEDDRLGIVGTAGSGKTYAAIAAAERLLDRGGRFIWVDALGVAWGFRLEADGRTPSPYDVVIIGGPHGDLPLNERAGGLIGEAVAGIKESVVVDLSEIGTAAGERRFMLAFLTALYRHASGEPVHLVLDEADLWAPQRILDKEGDATKLQAIVERIVRRGRVEGFVPWLITQRPAVLSKNVLSQVDGLVALKLTSSQDRDQLGAWIEGQADRAEGKAILGRLPEKAVGEAVIWIPGRRLLADVAFPAKRTFDSSRTPKRGEKAAAAELKPLDVGRLKQRMASVEKEAADNDPKALKAELARLRKELAGTHKHDVPAHKSAPAVDRADLTRQLEEARQAGRDQGHDVGFAKGRIEGFADALGNLQAGMEEAVRNAIAGLRKQFDKPMRAQLAAAERKAAGGGKLTYKSTASPPAPAKPPATRATVIPGPSNETSRSYVPGAAGDGPLLPSKMRILTAIAELNAIGRLEPEKELVAWLAGASPASSSFSNNLGSLRSEGYIDYPRPGAMALTVRGRELVPEVLPAINHAELMQRVARHLPPAQLRLLEAVVEVYPQALVSSELAAKIGASPTSSSFMNNKGRLRSLRLIDYPSAGLVRATDALFP